MWFRRSFEYRGKASARKLTVFVAFSLLVAAFIDHLYTGQIIQMQLLVVFSVIVLIGFGFLTAENLVELVRGKIFGNLNKFINNDKDSISARPRVDYPDDLQELDP